MERDFSEIIRVENRYYILATSSLADERVLVLKHGDTFGMFDRRGDVRPLDLGEHGLYHQGTRFLSRQVLRLGAERPLLLESTVTEDNTLIACDLTNPDMDGNGSPLVPRGILHVFRSKFVYNGGCYEQLRLHNYGADPIDVEVSYELEADFADIFEVRGTKRERRGTESPPVVEHGAMRFSYDGLDGVRRTTRVVPHPAPDEMEDGMVRYRLRVQPSGDQTVTLVVCCDLESPAADVPYAEALTRRRTAQRELEAGHCGITTSNEQFNDWVNRSVADLRMMLTQTPYGLYPYAGVPWYNCPFGRDALITAYETLWVNPDIALGVLRYLAETQATEVDSERDAEPGKILHEQRGGEMAATGEVPFERYYGTADATPLFVVLAGAYYDATADAETISAIWPNLEAALDWIDRYGDVDGDGFVEYAADPSRGLVQQGWKDSSDSVFHADGSLAPGPIAVCEVQGYVYAAKRRAARLASRLGKHDRAQELEAQAEALRERFEEAFWCPEIDTYALALDGNKRPCMVRASNAGHLLLSSIASPERAERVARQLLSDEFFSGWGIRTLAAGSVRFNPISYHNGSVWPHDNALIAKGLARYGFKDETMSVLAGLFDASAFVDLHRLPELFCGFPRRPGQGPTLYPVACSPQSWAAGAVFLLLRACLGLTTDADAGRLRVFYPVLPQSLQEVRIERMRLGTRSLDLVFHRYPTGEVGIDVPRRDDGLEVLVVK